METSESRAQTINVSFVLNGKQTNVNVEGRSILLDTLRDNLGLTGSKKGCGEGVCGACSVLLNDRVVCSCLMLTVEANGQEIMTIEGLSNEETRKIDPLQQAFIESDGAQCGFCTPGQIMSAKSFLNQLKQGNISEIHESEIKEALDGNLCRCGSYNGIIEAVRKVAKLQEKL